MARIRPVPSLALLALLAVPLAVPLVVCSQRGEARTLEAGSGKAYRCRPRRSRRRCRATRSGSRRAIISTAPWSPRTT